MCLFYVIAITILQTQLEKVPINDVLPLKATRCDPYFSAFVTQSL